MEEVLGDYDPTQKELDEIGREMDERDGRVRVHPLAESSMDYAVATHRWLQTRQARAGDADPVVRGSLDIIAGRPDRELERSAKVAVAHRECGRHREVRASLREGAPLAPGVAIRRRSTLGRT